MNYVIKFCNFGGNMLEMIFMFLNIKIFWKIKHVFFQDISRTNKHFIISTDSSLISEMIFQ